MKTGARRRRVDDRVARILRSLQDSGPSRPNLHLPRHARGRRPVVIINEAMAKEYWKTGDPLNDRLTIGRGGMSEFADEPDRQIIGVVADSRDDGLNQDPGPKMFVPQAQIPDR